MKIGAFFNFLIALAVLVITALSQQLSPIAPSLSTITNSPTSTNADSTSEIFPTTTNTETSIWLPSSSLPTTTFQTTSIITESSPHFSPTFAPTSNLPADASVVGPATIAYVMSTWTTASAYTSLKSAIFSAAPVSAQYSLAISGYGWEDIVSASWYTAVPTEYQEMVTKQEEALQSALNAAVGLNAGAQRMGACEKWFWTSVLLAAGLSFGVL